MARRFKASLRASRIRGIADAKKSSLRLFILILIYLLSLLVFILFLVSIIAKLRIELFAIFPIEFVWVFWVEQFVQWRLLRWNDLAKHVDGHSHRHMSWLR